MAIDDRRTRLYEAGAWLKQARRAAGLNQVGLAHLVGVTSASISAYENGKTEVSDLTAKAIANALGLGEVETRRGLGLYVPDGTPDDVAERVDVLAAIRADRRLLPEARRHLLSQYKLLLRIQAQDDPEQLAEEAANQQELSTERRLHSVNRARKPKP